MSELSGPENQVAMTRFVMDCMSDSEYDVSMCAIHLRLAALFSKLRGVGRAPR
jgi:hypothetical protein